MDVLVPFVVAGLVSGSVYGLAAVGLVLTYKTSGVFNFAHGALATVSAYAFYQLHVTEGLPWQVAAAICVLVVGPLTGLVLELLTRAVARATLELRIAATVGVLLVIEAGVVLLFGVTQVRTVPPFLPQTGFTVADTTVLWSDVVTFAVAVAITAAGSLAFRYSRGGAAMRAVVDDPDLLDLCGTSPVATRRTAWCLGAALASVAGVLFAPLLPLDALQLTLLVVQAFGAAAIGRFTNLPLTFVGGLVIGVVASICTRYFTDGLLAGVPAALPFLALFGVLLLLPKRYLVERSRSVQRLRAEWVAPGRLQLGAGAVTLAVLAAVPTFAGIHLTDWTVAVATTIVFLSLGLLVRTSGQVSLCHVAFTAIGAAGFSRLAIDVGLPWPLALLGCGLVAVPIGALLSIPAIRLSGLYLALATFGFGIVMQVMFYAQPYLFGPTSAGLPVPRPAVLGLDGDEAFYELVLALATVSAVVVVVLGRTRLGRLLRGLADSPTALSTNGVTVDVTRVLVFCLSAFMAAVGGALAAMAQTTISADSYQPLLSLTYFAVVVIVFGREPWYALVAAGALVLLPSYLSGPHFTTWLQLAFGGLAVLVAVNARRVGLPRQVTELVDRAFGRRDAPPGVDVAERRPTVPEGRLRLDDLTVRYGGVVAVGGFDLDASTGRITGLIGPNGAGKTTTFNACTGLVQATGGRVVFDGRPITRAPTALRARLGLGRTFQQMELFDSLSVGENVSIGAEGRLAGRNPLAHALSRPGDARRVAAATAEALRLCGIDNLARARVGSLSTGQRRLVELARCLAGPYRVLLLDEPSSGLDRAESARFGQILQQVVRQRGVGILIVEHDMSLVLDVCDDVYVLDFGRPLFHGTPEQVRGSSTVQAAYLGEPEAEEAAQAASSGRVEARAGTGLVRGTA